MPLAPAEQKVIVTLHELVDAVVFDEQANEQPVEHDYAHERNKREEHHVHLVPGAAVGARVALERAARPHRSGQDQNVRVEHEDGHYNQHRPAEGVLDRVERQPVKLGRVEFRQGGEKSVHHEHGQEKSARFQAKVLQEHEYATRGQAKLFYARVMKRAEVDIQVPGE